MRKMKKLLAFLLAFTLVFGCMSGVASAETGTRPADGKTEEQPFAPGTGGSQNFRIPCLVSLDDGTIVAACDARWNHASDACGLDTIVSYSKDNGATWNYTFANYLGDNGNKFSYNSTAFIDPAIASDGENIYMIADLYPAGIAINTTPNTHRPLVGSTGFNEEDQLILAAATDTVNGLSPSADRIAQPFDYHLEKNPEEGAESYYLLKNAEGNTVEGYVIDAYFNITGEGVDTNIFCGDSPYFPWPADYLYMTKSSDGGATWSAPTLLNLKKASEQTLLVGPGRGIYTSTGRIVFTCYEFTNYDRNSACIYSDDGGVTWERGASVSGWSSEAVVTEADGKLYMFTRHGGYYVSDDWGETWSTKIEPGITYNLNCQLTAITYSEKIDGKTAILFAAPSSTTSRSAGKIFVGLVQDNGSLDWAYEYSINGSATYAYSCLTELNDGSLGLLYESAGSAITYKNIAITDVAKGAAIGNIWCTNDQGEPVANINMKPGQSVTLNVAGTVNSVQASSNSDALTASISGNQLTLAADSSATGLERVVVTLTDGENTFKLYVNVAAAEQYEIVDLRMGDTKTYTVDGNYSDADLTGLDTSIAKVTVTSEGEEGSGEVQAQLASSAGNFDVEQLVNVSNSLYTFTSSGEANKYTVSSRTTDGTEVFLNLNNTGKQPNKTTAATIEVKEGSTEGTFKLHHTDANTTAGGAYLHFYEGTNQTYDRCGSDTCGSKHEYEIYAPSASAPDNSPIPGYVKVTALQDIQSGGEYLIAKKDGESYYIMYPSSSGNNYTHVAKVTDVVSGARELGAQLASSAGNFDVEELVKVSNNLYTFTSASEENQYTVSSTTSDGTKVYLNIQTSGKLPNRTTASTIEVKAGSTAGTFKLYDTTASRYLHFYEGGDQTFDRCGNDTCGSKHEYELYALSTSAPDDSPIPGYAKVTALTEIQSDGSYLIAKKDGESYYIMHPSNSGNNYDYSAKIVGYIQPKMTTDIVIEGVAEGKTSVKIGDTTYYINVKNDVKNVTLKVGESFVAPGKLMQQTEGQQVVTLENNTTRPPYAKVTEIKEGNYLFGNDTHVVINSASTAGGNPQGLAMSAAKFQKEDLSQYVWTLTKVGGGYTIQDAAGKYITINGQNVTLSDTAQTLAITVRNAGNNSFQVSGNNMYLNNWAGSNNRVAAYSSSDNDWYFYQPAEGIVLTAAEAGTTSVVIGGTTYNITVEAQHVHAFGEWTVTTEATCTTEGLKERTCACGEKETEVLDALGHSYGDWTVTTAPTCTEKGVETRTCSHDSTHVETRDVDALGHDYGEWTQTKAPTCTEKGEETRTCSHDSTHVETREIPATGKHTYGEWVVVKEATKEEAGLEKATCACGDEITREIPKLPATEEDKQESQKYFEECQSYYSEEKYSATTNWKAYTAAMEALKAVLADDTATLDEIAQAVAAVEAAAQAMNAEVEQTPDTPEPPVAPEKPATPATPEKPNQGNVQTGDAASMMVWIMLIAAAGVVLIIRKRKVR